MIYVSCLPLHLLACIVINNKFMNAYLHQQIKPKELTKSVALLNATLDVSQ